MIELWIKAGEIAKKIKKRLENKDFYGKKVRDVCEYIENLIVELGGKPAFPVNICMDEIAAHDTAGINDERIIECKVLKIDFGVHIDGYIVDTAFTIVFDEKYEDLKEASEKALEKAIEILRPGIKTREIGKVIEETIKKYGLRPIYNLTGHEIKRYNLHAGLSIPNFDDKSKSIIRKGSIIAIEPFVTNGKGFVVDDGESNIYKLEKNIGIRFSTLRDIINYVKREYDSLPFASRWLEEKFGKEKTTFFLRLGVRSRVFYSYPRLVEASGGLVGQAEHTILVDEEAVVLT